VKIKSQKELEKTLECIELDLIACKITAVKSYVQSLAAQAITLRYALGWSEIDNRKRHLQVTAHTLQKWFKLPGKKK